MRVNRLFVFLNALVLALANLAVPFALAALPYHDATYQLISCAFAGLVFLLAASENRWRFPWWGSLTLAVTVVFFAGWLATQDQEANLALGIKSHGTIPLIYLLLVAQALLLVKLTGPRTPVDFWGEQGAGLVFVLIGCLSSREPLFGVLLLLYLATAVVAVLAHHFQQRQEGAAVCRVHVTVRPVRAPVPEPVGRLRPRALVFWGLVVVPLVMLAFFCVPRPDFVWGEGAGVGPFSDGMNLNKTGPVRLGTGTAFTVTVTEPAHVSAPNELLAQRWRGAVLTTYQNGRWYPAQQNWGKGRKTGPLVGPLTATKNERQFDFTVTPKDAGGMVLADPVVAVRADSIRVNNAPWGHYPPFHPETGTFEQIGSAHRDSTFHYTQLTPTGADPDRTPQDHLDSIEEMDSNVPPGIRSYTRTLLRTLAEQELYGLQEDDAEGDGDPTPHASVRGERIAVALTKHLNSSRDFAYTLDRPRIDKKIDPTEDFLVNVHQGHCERFASGLALMLRSQGVPARVVVGFRGSRGQGNGQYVVPQSHAHAWVEALVPPKGTSAVGAAVGGPGSDYYHNNLAEPEWLALDPTSPYPPPVRPMPTTWLSSLLGSIGSWFNGIGSNWNFNFVNFNGNMQADFFAWVSANLPYLLVAVLVLGALIYLTRYAMQWLGWTPAATAVAEPFYQRLLHLLAWYRGLEPQPAQTPREFGAAAAVALEAEPKSRGVAGLPAWIVELYYRVRFGGRPLTEDEKRAVEGRLEELQAGLK